MTKEGSEEKSTDALDHAEGFRSKGNVLANKGKYADACDEYSKGLQALEHSEGADPARISEIKLFLHLNLALTQLRRGSSLSPVDIPAITHLRIRALLAAVEHGGSAIALDDKCVKAWYRRGCAHLRLGEHPGRRPDVKSAATDFQKVLELDPENQEATKKLEYLKKECGWAFDDSAGESGDGAALEASGQDEEQADGTNSIAGAIRPSEARELSHKLILSAKDITYYGAPEKRVFKDLHLDLRAGWSVGFIGADEDSGSMLAQLMCGRLQPHYGRLIHHGCVAAPPGTATSTAVFVVVAFSIASLFVARAFLSDPFTSVAVHLRDLDKLSMGLAILSTAVILLAIGVQVERRNNRRKSHRVTVMTSNKWGSSKERLPPHQTVDEVIGEGLQSRLGSSERKRCVAAMLKAAGFSLLEESKGKSSDTLEYGALSDIQKHLVYLLRCFASVPKLFVCDEILKGLLEVGSSAPSQEQVQVAARVLRMMRRLQEERDIGILYISKEPRELRLAADSLSVAGGSLGLASEVLDAPEHPAAKYFSNCHGPCDKLAEFYTNLSGDDALAGPWLPPKI